MWAHGVPVHDVFSYTATSFPWVDHEWLSDILTAGLYAAGGLGLVAAWFATVWTAAIVLAVRTMVHRPVWPVYALGFAAIAADAVARPNAWTALGLAVVLWATHRGGWRGHRRWWLVAVFGLWANMHGGFAIGLVALAIAVVRDRGYLPILVWCGVATLINPYGTGVYVEIWRTISDTQLHSTIGEWQPLSIGVVNGFYIAVWLFVAMAGRWRYELVLPVMLLLGSVGSQRQFPLFVVASLGLLAEGYGRMAGLLHLERGWRAWVLPVLATALAVVPVVKIVEHPHNDWPVRGLTSLRERPCEGRIFNDYNFGGLLLWHVPGAQVYIDGRMPSWREGEVSYMVNFRRVLDETDFARAEFERYGVKCALLEKQHGRLIKQLVAEGWRVDVKDEYAVLLRQ